MKAVADSSFLVAFSIPSEMMNQPCRQLYQKFETIYIPQTTLAETSYFLTKHGGNYAVLGFFEALSTSKFVLYILTSADVERAAQILRHYVDTRLDFIDATVVAVAERLKIASILTLDRRDFGFVIPRHTAYFEILP